jgi:hypothetical protein
VYCKKCYAELVETDGFNRCPRCGLGFDPADRSTYLRRPFPTIPRIILHIFLTTVFGFIAAYIVAIHQLSMASGH